VRNGGVLKNDRDRNIALHRSCREPCAVTERDEIGRCSASET
jgi:hypothetical protein